jgi:aquaporin Z
MARALECHWPEYLIEASGLGVFMITACSFAVALEHPISPIRDLLPALPRRALMGLAMGATAISIIYSPWGKRSGAHINPAVTWTFFRLGKVPGWDALFYVLAQFIGGVAGVAIAFLALGALVSHPSVNYVATLPGPRGVALAFAAEMTMSFVLMWVVLLATNQPKLARFTGIFAGVLVFAFITLEAPISGMSMNPARTFASAFNGGLWSDLWVYFAAPPTGMGLAAEVYRRRTVSPPVRCAKLHHDNRERCIFRCGYASPADDGRAEAP